MNTDTALTVPTQFVEAGGPAIEVVATRGGETSHYFPPHERVRILVLAREVK